MSQHVYTFVVLIVNKPH